MTDPNTALPPALRRALELLADPPTNPDVSKGYLDLLGTRPIEDAAPPQYTRAQALFASPVGSMLYDHTQAVMRRLFTAFQLRTVWLNIPPGGIALDVGCGTGSVTASLARAAGPDGLALGVDISEPMLARAGRRGRRRRFGGGRTPGDQRNRAENRSGGVDGPHAADPMVRVRAALRDRA